MREHAALSFEIDLSTDATECHEHADGHGRAESQCVGKAEVACWTHARADSTVEGVDPDVVAAEREGEDYGADLGREA